MSDKLCIYYNAVWRSCTNRKTNLWNKIINGKCNETNNNSIDNKTLKSSYCVLLCQIYGGLNIYFFHSQLSLRDYLKKNLSKLSNKSKKKIKSSLCTWKSKLNWGFSFDNNFWLAPWKQRIVLLFTGKVNATHKDDSPYLVVNVEERKQRA